MNDTDKKPAEYNKMPPEPPEDILRALDLFQTMIYDNDKQLFVPVIGLYEEHYKFEMERGEEETIRFNYLYGKLEKIINDTI